MLRIEKAPLLIAPNMSSPNTLSYCSPAMEIYILSLTSAMIMALWLRLMKRI